MNTNTNTNTNSNNLLNYTTILNDNINKINLIQIVNELNNEDMNNFLSTYEKTIDELNKLPQKSLYVKKIIKFALQYSNLEYIQHLVSKYNFNEFKSFDLYRVVKNSNPNILEFYVSQVKNIYSTDVIESYILTDIEFNKLKFLLTITSYTNDEYLLLLRGTGQYNNLKNFKLVYDCCNDLLNVTKTFIAREEPLAGFMDYRDYSKPYECDLLLYCSDSNSYNIVEYLLELNVFSISSIKNAYQYVEENQQLVRLIGNKRIDNKDKTMTILKKYIK